MTGVAQPAGAAGFDHGDVLEGRVSLRGEFSRLQPLLPQVACERRPQCLGRDGLAAMGRGRAERLDGLTRDLHALQQGMHGELRMAVHHLAVVGADLVPGRGIERGVEAGQDHRTLRMARDG